MNAQQQQKKKKTKKEQQKKAEQKQMSGEEGEGEGVPEEVEGWLKWEKEEEPKK